MGPARPGPARYWRAPAAPAAFCAHLEGAGHRLRLPAQAGLAEPLHIDGVEGARVLFQTCPLSDMEIGPCIRGGDAPQQRFVRQRRPLAHSRLQDPFRAEWRSANAHRASSPDVSRLSVVRLNERYGGGPYAGHGHLTKRRRNGPEAARCLSGLFSRTPQDDRTACDLIAFAPCGTSRHEQHDTPGPYPRHRRRRRDH